MARVMVTGGCGFIGSNFIRHLLEQDASLQVINYDCLTYAGNPENLKDLDGNPRYLFVYGDITNPISVRHVVGTGVDAIFHFAAESHVDRSIQNASPFVKTNVLGTLTLLQAARAFHVERFIQVSTDEVYGSLGPTGLFAEETPLAPNSPYSASKASADLLARSYFHTYGLPVLITRCSNNYGPYQFPEKLIPLFITNLLANEQVPVYGDGKNVRDWIHVRDHCAGVYQVWKKGRVGEVYNLGGRAEKTNLEITHLLLQALDKPTSLIKYVPDRLGHDRRYAIDCAKAERELGWRPQIAFEQGIQQTIEWYKANTPWVQKIRSGAYRQAQLKWSRTA